MVGARGARPPKAVRSQCSDSSSRRGQRGLTLIEVLVTIGLMTVAMLGIGAAIASTERTAAINQSQAQLQLWMRQEADFVRDSTSQGLPYTPCASRTTYSSQLSGAGRLASAPVLPAGLVITVAHVYESNSGTRSGVSGISPALPGAGQNCSGNADNVGASADWGVQEVVLQVTDSASHVVKRTVWKGAFG